MENGEIIWGRARDLYEKFNINIRTSDLNLKQNNFAIFLQSNNKLLEILELTKLEWDSNHFDKNIWSMSFLLNSPSLTTPMLNNLESTLENLCLSLSIDCLFCRTEISFHHLVHWLENMKFNLMDTLVTMEYVFNNKSKYSSDNKHRLTLVNDSLYTNQIMQIAEQIYTTDRFHTDPHLNNIQCNKLYSCWVKNQSEKSDADIFILEKRPNILAFAICKHLNNEEVNIQLLGVEPKYQGKKLGKELIQSLLSYYYEKKVKKVTIGTQLTNIRAIKCYLSEGFKIVSSQHNFHKHLHNT